MMRVNHFHEVNVLQRINEHTCTIYLYLLLLFDCNVIQVTTEVSNYRPMRFCLWLNALHICVCRSVYLRRTPKGVREQWPIKFRLLLFICHVCSQGPRYKPRLFHSVWVSGNDSGDSLSTKNFVKRPHIDLYLRFLPHRFYVKPFFAQNLCEEISGAIMRLIEMHLSKKKEQVQITERVLKEKYAEVWRVVEEEIRKVCVKKGNEQNGKKRFKNIYFFPSFRVWIFTCLASW